MSTLTSSPSPAASPRSAFHIQRAPSYSTSSSRQASGATRSPRAFNNPTSSPRRSFHAPPSSTYSAGAGSGARQPREHYIESPAVEKAPRFVDAGTQYSPDGYPPTTRRTQGSEQQERPSVIQTHSPSKKRKEPESPEPMSTSGGTSSSASSGPSHARRNPNEPNPRLDPSAIELHRAAAAVAGPSSIPDSEPQEARSTHGHSSAPKRSRPEPGSAKVMPLQYETCDPKDLGVLTASMLMELIRLNDQIPLRDGRLTRFHSRAPPGISVSDYLQRLIHHATLSPPILLSMVWYIDRLCQLYPAFTINSLTVHRFLITAATVAAKGLSDAFWTNPTYARIGGIPVSELATLELEFLQKVAWKIVPKPEVLEDYYRSLVERTEGYELERSPGEQGSDSTSVGSSDLSKGGSERDEDEDMKDEPT